MNLNNFRNIGDNWKKIIVICLSIVFLMFLIREIFFLSLFGEAKYFITSVNQKIDAHDQQINKFMNDADKEFTERSERFDHAMEKFSKGIDKVHEQFQNEMDETMSEMSNKEKEFNENWKKHFDQMDKESDELAAKMAKNYEDSVEKSEKKFKVDLLAREKEEEKVHQLYKKRYQHDARIHI